MIGNRTTKQMVKAIFGRHHYTAFINMFHVYSRPWENLWRYLTANGDYPYEVEIKTPTGVVKPILYSYHDLLTVNEIFCRQDYSAANNINIVVDIGSNIGISALYFLSRNIFSKCYLFEPDSRNIEKLRKTLFMFEDRYKLFENAVSSNAGEFEFGIEETGRYGGLTVKSTKNIKVQCLEINTILERILATEKIIDILKIDTEGVEIDTVNAIKPEYLKFIKKIYLEAHPQSNLHATSYYQRQYGSVCQLVTKSDS